MDIHVSRPQINLKSRTVNKIVVQINQESVSIAITRTKENALLQKRDRK